MAPLTKIVVVAAASIIVSGSMLLLYRATTSEADWFRRFGLYASPHNTPFDSHTKRALTSTSLQPSPSGQRKVSIAKPVAVSQTMAAVPRPRPVSNKIPVPLTPASVPVRTTRTPVSNLRPLPPTPSKMNGEKVPTARVPPSSFNRKNTPTVPAPSVPTLNQKPLPNRPSVPALNHRPEPQIQPRPTPKRPVNQTPWLPTSKLHNDVVVPTFVRPSIPPVVWKASVPMRSLIPTVAPLSSRAGNPSKVATPGTNKNIPTNDPTLLPTYFNFEASNVPSVSAEPTTFTIPPSTIQTGSVENKEVSDVRLQCPKPSPKCPGTNLMYNSRDAKCETACVTYKNYERRRKAGWRCGPCASSRMAYEPLQSPVMEPSVARPTTNAQPLLSCRQNASADEACRNNNLMYRSSGGTCAHKCVPETFYERHIRAHWQCGRCPRT